VARKPPAPGIRLDKQRGQGYLCRPRLEPEPKTVANHVSAAKRARQTLKITERNKHFRTTTRTHMKRVRAAISAGDRATAQAALKECIKRVDQAVSKGLWHRKAGSRYVSRLSAAVHGMK
jgi:small subunit ribosomal protein S20